MRVNLNGFRLRSQADRERLAVHVQAHGGTVPPLLLSTSDIVRTLYPRRHGSRRLHALTGALVGCISLDHNYMRI